MVALEIEFSCVRCSLLVLRDCQTPGTRVGRRSAGRGEEGVAAYVGTETVKLVMCTHEGINLTT